MTDLGVPDFTGRTVLVVGDLMLDAYLWGDVDRISPEAPVQVVAVKREAFTLGGAGNVIHNLVALGATVLAAGIIGDGADGDRMIERFDALGVDVGGVIREDGRVTTRKTRVIADNQHVLRIDRETRMPVGEAARARLAQFVTERAGTADIVLVSDYDKGLVTPDLMAEIVRAAGRHGKMVLCDPKSLDFSKYAGASLLTPNRKEAGLAAGIEIRDPESLRAAGEKLLADAAVERLLITRGPDGMALFDGPGPPTIIRAEARQVYDVSGAGDTVLAVLGLGLAAGLSFETSARLANTAAGIVVGKVGTAAVTREELTQALGTADTPLRSKARGLREISAIAEALRARGQKVVLTNGCFDLLHTGHILLFAASRRIGDALVVAIDDDAAVRAVKGPGRPVLGLDERVRLLSALDAVDHVVVYPTDGLPEVIQAVRPDVLTKGSNYTSEAVVGRELVESLGGRVERIPITETVSASRIIEHIRRGEGSG